MHIFKKKKEEKKKKKKKKKKKGEVEGQVEVEVLEREK